MKFEGKYEEIDGTVKAKWLMGFRSDRFSGSKWSSEVFRRLLWLWHRSVMKVWVRKLSVGRKNCPISLKNLNFCLH